MDDPWKILGIAPTSDTRRIKKAYTARVKRTHPEDDPEGFQRLRLAYEMAIAFARWTISEGAEDATPPSTQLHLPGVVVTMPSGSARIHPFTPSSGSGAGAPEEGFESGRPRLRTPQIPPAGSPPGDRTPYSPPPELRQHDSEGAEQTAEELMKKVAQLRSDRDAWLTTAAWKEVLRNEVLWDIDTRAAFQQRLFSWLVLEHGDVPSSVLSLLNEEFRWTDQRWMFYRLLPREQADSLLDEIDSIESVQDAERACEEGRYGDAVARLEPLARRLRGELRLRAFLTLGRAYLGTDTIEGAERALDEALRVDPRCVPALLLLARVLRSGHQTSKASHLYRSVLRIDPKNEEASRELKIVEAGSGALSARVPSSQEPAVWNVDNRAALWIMGACALLFLLAVGVASRRSSPGSQHAPLQRGTPVELQQRGREAARNGDHAQAARLLSTAAGADGGLKDVFLQLGQAYAQTGQDEEALRAFSRQVEIDPSHRSAYSWRAFVLERLTRWDEAKRDLLKQIEVGTAAAWPYQRLGARRSSERRFKEAAALYAKAASIEPKKAEHWLGLAWAQQLDGRPGEARSALESARALDLADWQKVKVGSVYEFAGEPAIGGELAASALPSIARRLAALSGESFSQRDLFWTDMLARAWHLLGASALAEGREQRAEAYLRAGSRIGFLPRGLWLLGELRVGQGEHAEALGFWLAASLLPSADLMLPADHESRIEAVRQRMGVLSGSRDVSSAQARAFASAISAPIPLSGESDLKAPVLLLVRPDGSVERARTQSKEDSTDFDQSFAVFRPIRLPVTSPDNRPFKMVLQAALTCSPLKKCSLALIAPSHQGLVKAFEGWSKKDREAENRAKPSESHPLAGFWKAYDCGHEFGLAIGPSGEGTYYVSFCGPGGCFVPGAYRPDTSIRNDPSYRVVDEDTVEVKGREGFTRYVRCPGREVVDEDRALSATPMPVP